jgi:hypothetical protein
MSIAVEHERFILTANILSGDILCGIAHKRKPDVPSGGIA